MSKLILLLSLLFLTGCFFNPNPGAPTEEPREAPRIGEPDEHGKVLYTPDPSTEVLDQEVPTEHCDVSEVDHDVPPQPVDSEVVNVVFATVEFDHTEDVPSSLRGADHIHLEKMRLRSVAGDSFHFLSWVRLSALAEGQEDVMVAWGRELQTSNYDVSLSVDGQVDLAPYLQEQVRLKGSLRAKAPRTKTYVEASLRFIVFKNCEWY